MNPRVTIVAESGGNEGLTLAMTHVGVGRWQARPATPSPHGSWRTRRGVSGRRSIGTEGKRGRDPRDRKASGGANDALGHRVARDAPER